MVEPLVLLSHWKGNALAVFIISNMVFLGG